MDRERTYAIKTPRLNTLYAIGIIENLIEDYMDNEGAYPSVISVSYKLYDWIAPELSQAGYFKGVKIISSCQEERASVIS